MYEEHRMRIHAGWLKDLDRGSALGNAVRTTFRLTPVESKYLLPQGGALQSAACLACLIERKFVIDPGAICQQHLPRQNRLLELQRAGLRGGDARVAPV